MFAQIVMPCLPTDLLRFGSSIPDHVKRGTFEGQPVSRRAETRLSGLEDELDQTVFRLRLDELPARGTRGGDETFRVLRDSRSPSVRVRGASDLLARGRTEVRAYRAEDVIVTGVVHQKLTVAAFLIRFTWKTALEKVPVVTART